MPGCTEALYDAITTQVLETFALSKHYLGICELWAFYIFVVDHAQALAGRDLRMFIDNIGVIANLVKGSTGRHNLAVLLTIILVILASLDTRVWFEYVDTDSNPSDGLSRYGLADPLSQRMGWVPVQSKQPTWPGPGASAQTILEHVQQITNTCYSLSMSTVTMQAA